MMREKKALGFYVAALAGVMGIVSLIRFFLWAPDHNTMDAVIVAALLAGIILDVVLVIRDHAFVIIAATACYSIAAVKILTDSVGSFVDAFQGINMFGDATQVGTIISLAIGMAISILLSILASFMKRVKE